MQPSDPSLTDEMLAALHHMLNPQTDIWGQMDNQQEVG
jgi:hypothetical protein